MPNDIGRFVGRYTQVLACISIIGMIIGALFFKSLFVDFSVVLMFWIANYLIQHNPNARTWMIVFCGFGIAVLATMFIVAATNGTQNVFIVLAGKKIDHPSFLVLTIVILVEFVLVTIPLVLLLTPQAKEEFRRNASLAGP